MLQFQGLIPEIDEIIQMWNQNLDSGTIAALGHIFDSEISDLFSFGVSDYVKDELKGISQMFLSEIL